MSPLSPNNRETWSTRVGVILAVTGSAVGLGNFLRFPGQAAQYGGGVFMVPYAVAFLLLGLPIAFVEWSMGRYGGDKGHNSSPGIFRAVVGKPNGSYLGILGSVIPVVIYMYYVFVEAWCLGYAWNYLIGGKALGEDPGRFFTGFAGMTSHGEVFMNPLSSSLVFLVICFILNFILIYRGLTKGIEWFCKWAMPGLVICAIIVLFRVLTLGTPDPSKPDQNLMNGLGYMWNPVHQAENLAPGDQAVQALLSAATSSSIQRDKEQNTAFSVTDAEAFKKTLAENGWTAHGEREGDTVYGHKKSRLEIRTAQVEGRVATPSFWQALSNPEIWLAAAGQIFFSLSVGFGIVITYASYLRRDDDIALSSITACAGNGFCEVALGGLITIPAAFIFLGVSTVANPPGTFGMGFVALPNVFNQMPAGAFFGFLFFFLLFLAAVTSSLSMLQPAIALLEEGLGIGRKASVALLGFITATGCGFIVYFSKDAQAMDTVDFWVGNVFIYIMATIQVVLFAWVLGIDRGWKELMRGAEIRVPSFVKYIIKYVSPVYLLIIFALWLSKSAPDRVRAVLELPEDGPPVVMLSVGLIILVVVLFTLIIAQANRTWNRNPQE